MNHEIVVQGYLIKKKKTISAPKAEEIRNVNISAQINASIRAAILGGGSMDAIRNSISDGFKRGKEQVEDLENLTEYKSEYFQYGDRESLARIKEIESDPQFDKWLDELTISDIKNSVSDFSE
jgi:hypothetical protein